MAEPPLNQFALLKTRRFLPLFLVQFLGAFNDQVYQKAFVALITFRLADRLEGEQEALFGLLRVDWSFLPADTGGRLALLGVIASGLFILPFALFTPTAGQIADRVDKAKMMRVVKAWEIVVMGLAVVGYYSQDVIFLYVVLFLMGAQSAMFAPVKYSVLPQYLHPQELVGGNGLVQGFTFLAIIFGTILGNELILREWGVAVVSATVVGVAVAGFVASLYAPPAPPVSAPHGPVDWVFPRAIWRLIAMCRANRPAFRAMLAIAWFWFLGATFLSLLPAYARDSLGVDEGVLTILLAGFSIGVALGAIASEALSGGEVGVTLPPLGALGLAVFAVELYLATPAAPLGAEGALLGRAEFFASFAGWRILADFVILAAFAGLYVTPLNAVLQVESPPETRAQFIACSNVIDASLIVASAGMVAAFFAAGLDTTEVLTVVTLSGLPMAFVVARYAPETRMGRVALALWPRGPQ